MAANQRRKRLSSASVVGHSSREPYRVRKKNLALPRSDANLRPHITLAWDGSKKRVVSKREQIGISWRKLKPFVDSVPKEQTILADVFDVPHEIFGLEDLSEVLSLEVAIFLSLALVMCIKVVTFPSVFLSIHLALNFLQVWHTYLSENERNNLRKFLPGEQENETDLVGELFSGNNFHFGNPLVKWQVVPFPKGGFQKCPPI